MEKIEFDIAKQKPCESMLLTKTSIVVVIIVSVYLRLPEGQ